MCDGLTLPVPGAGDAGAVALARVLAENASLRMLDLRANYIGDVGE